MKNAAKWMMIGGGAILLLGAGSGFLVTTLSMSLAFSSLGDSGVSAPKTIAIVIGHALLSSVIGLSIAALGLISLITGLIIFLLNKRDSTARAIRIKTTEQGAGANG